MRSHGVSNFPDPTGGHLPLQIQQTPNSTTVNGVEVNGPAFQSAMQACRSYIPNAGTPSAAETAKAKPRALAMSRCMRSHGVPNFPDPKTQTGPYGGVAFSVDFGGTGIDPNSPAFQAAQKDCGSIIGALKIAPGRLENSPRCLRLGFAQFPSNSADLRPDQLRGFAFDTAALARAIAIPSRVRILKMSSSNSAKVARMLKNILPIGSLGS